MAHRGQLAYLALLSKHLSQLFRNTRVLEVGSLDINGSVRRLFEDCDYVGLDVANGPGVDVVCEGQRYDAPESSFDVVLSCEAMEHNPYWVDTFKNMIRLCRPGGVVIMTCATTGRPEHGTARSSPGASPLTVRLGWNYYRNLTEIDFRNAVDVSSSFAAYRFWTNWNHYDLLFVGIKRGTPPSNGATVDWEAVTRAVDEWLSRESGARVHRYRAIMARTIGERWFLAMHRILDALAWLHRVR